MPSQSTIKNGIDLHTHCSPSIFPRKLTVWEMVQEAKENQLGGIVLKSHESSTSEQAAVINMAQSKVPVYGGIVLNEFVGGLNPASVDVSLKMGGKFVWMPTISSKQHIEHFSGKEGRLFQGIDDLFHSNKGISLLNQSGKLKSEVYEILHLIKKYDAVLCSGHISVNELKVLAEAAFQEGIEKFLITHPDMEIAPVPIDYQKELTKRGALLEKCYLAASSDFNNSSIIQLKESIDEIGHQHCVLVTDYGQSFNITPIQAMKKYIDTLIEMGLTNEQIHTMYVDNAHYLIKGKAN